MNQQELIQDILGTKFQTSFSVTQTNEGYQITPDSFEDLQNSMEFLNIDDAFDLSYQIQEAVNLLF